MAIKVEDLDKDYDTLSFEQALKKYGNNKEFRDAIRTSNKWGKAGSDAIKYVDQYDEDDLKVDQGEDPTEYRPDWLDDNGNIIGASTSDTYDLNPKITKEQIREKYKDDNTGYTNALKARGESPKDQSKDRYKIKSIQDAYYDGEIDKNTRDYMMADTLSKFAGNLGKSFGNVRAQLTGGTIDNDREDSLWNQRNKSMMEGAVGSERNQIKGSSEEQKYRSTEANITGQNLQNARESISQIPAQRFMDDAKSLRAKAANITDEQQKADYEACARLFELIGAGSLNGVDIEEYVAAFAASEPGGLELIKNLANTGNEMALAVAGMASAVGEGVKGISNAVNKFTGGDKWTNPYKAPSEFTGFTDRGNDIDEKTYKSLLKDYNVKDNGNLEQLRQDMAKQVTAKDPEVWKLVDKITKMSPEERAKFVSDHYLALPFRIPGNKKQRDAMNIARLLGYDVSYQNYQ